ncbi:MAG: sigma-70 family RNA polymerase sigma factor [Kiritimatiellae bacterium]|nr:sigma-70 family RNA polymerase sigma factor [Kiritimatiellia bacterium]
MKPNEPESSASMDGFNITHPSLIFSVIKGNPPSYDRFYRIYKPLIELRCRKCGLTPDETEELIQDVMCAFFDQAKKFCYDPGKSFKNYFYGIIKYRMYDLWRRKKRAERELLFPPEDFEHIAEAVWPNHAESEEEEWIRYIYQTAKEEMRGHVPPMTYQVFLLLLEKDAEPKAIAKRLGIALSSFYNHKKAALEAYRQILTELKELR